MKYLKYILIATVVLMTACEQNDPVANMGETMGEVPNVYLATLSPIAWADTDIELKIQYWSIENSFSELGLYETIDTAVVLNFKLNPASVDYTYEIEYWGRIQDDMQVTTEQHDIGKWVPAQNAYVLARVYTPATEHKLKKYTNRETDISSFEALMPDTLEQHLYIDLSNELDKIQLSTILVEQNAVMTTTTFDACFSGTSKTETGLQTLQTKLKEVGFQNLVGGTYKLSVQHGIVLRFKAANTNGAWGSSYARYFNIQ